MENVVVEFRPDRVANLLKDLVNKHCTDDFEWYPDVGEMPTFFDIMEAIRVLENEKVGSIKLVEDVPDSERSE